MLSTKEILAYLQDEKPADGKKVFTQAEARSIGEALGIQWEKFDVEQFRMGLNTELEHGRRDPMTDVTHDEPLVTGKIALAHLNDIPDYYTHLAVMERDAEREKVAERGEVGAK
jgi:hypothetical protein